MNIVSKLKKQDGSMAVYVLIVLLSMLMILTAVYSITTSERRQQLLTIINMKQAYEANNGNAVSIYENLLGTNQQPEQIVNEYSFTGDEQIFTAPIDGLYKLQVWGAQGGSFNQANGVGGKRWIF